MKWVIIGGSVWLGLVGFAWALVRVGSGKINTRPVMSMDEHRQQIRNGQR